MIKCLTLGSAGDVCEGETEFQHAGKFATTLYTNDNVQGMKSTHLMALARPGQLGLERKLAVEEHCCLSALRCQSQLHTTLAAMSIPRGFQGAEY